MEEIEKIVKRYRNTLSVEQYCNVVALAKKMRNLDIGERVVYYTGPTPTQSRIDEAFVLLKVARKLYDMGYINMFQARACPADKKRAINIMNYIAEGCGLFL